VWSFDNGALITPCTASTDHCIGIISGTASWSKDSAYHLYFASREYDASNNGTLWCIDFTAAGASLCNSGIGWPVALGDIDGSPILEGGYVYVGTNSGTVYKVDAATGGTPVWSYGTNDGAVKGYVSPDPGSSAIFLATTDTIWSLADNGSSVGLNWSDDTTITSPSVPLFAPHTSADYLYVGTGDGYVYQVNVSGPTPAFTAQQLGLAFSTSSAVGQPALDVANEMIYAGTEAGALYSADVPFLESKAHAPD
jgi:outer membrane protein assembly factor BamB